ncbi:MAG: hypothetical protein IPO80_04745 [Propionibacteriaceae bacterium]|nr:hypothetical protein [Propionibacteriaceae bacterium]
MSVAQELGMIDHNPNDDDVASRPQSLAEWVAAQADALPHGDLHSLRRWLRETDPQVVDRFLVSVAGWAAVDGGNDVMAAKLLAWALLPGAARLARELRVLSAEVDHLVASRLWIEVRTFPWQRRSRVAAWILRQTKNGVLADCQVPSRLRRHDPAWFMVDPSPRSMAAIPAAVAPLDSRGELLLLLEWAVEEGVITADDRLLLLGLVQASDLEPERRSCTMAGLLAHRVSGTVGDALGVSARTVRRRASRCLRALAEAAPSYTLVAS